MTQESAPEGEPLKPREMIGRLIKRDLPNRAGPSEWCGIHPKERTQLIARSQWVCAECVRESSRG